THRRTASGGRTRADSTLTPGWILDASAVLAWLQDEPGAGTVDALVTDAVVSAPNWSEVLQKVAQHGRDADEVRGLLLALGLEVIPLTEEDAASAARLWLQAPALSLGDRCCLAVARRLELPAITADREWLGLALGVEIRPIR
ncbi:MAG: PIN domain-containing protein, partial [Chloroflexota bacterium]